jgi:hypothetical protein
MAKSFGQQVKEALGTIEAEVTISEAEAHVRQMLNGVIDEHGEKLASDALRGVIRREFKATRDEDGLSEWQSIERQTADGETEKVYRQLTLCDREDFKLLIDYHAQKVEFHAGPTSTGPTSTGPTSTGPTSTGPTSTGPTSTGPTNLDGANLDGANLYGANL